MVVSEEGYKGKFRGSSIREAMNEAIQQFALDYNKDPFDIKIAVCNELIVNR